jgi:hypothetical protein
VNDEWSLEEACDKFIAAHCNTSSNLNGSNDPKGEAVELATALRNAKIPFMIAQSRAGTGPYPPPNTITHNWSNATKLKSALTLRT